MSNDDIREALARLRQPYDANAPSGAGLHAIFLKPRGQLLPIEPGASGLLFIAGTHHGPGALDHFTAASSSVSTLRRSLGAILRKHLWLQPCPRAPGAGEASLRNFAFIPDSEAVLSRWMRANLLVATLPMRGNLAAIEADLIADLEPPLNLTGWSNPQRPLVRRMRAECARIARELARLAA